MKKAASFFRRLADILDAKPAREGDPVAPPYELTDHEIAGLRDLRRLEEWEIFLTALDRRTVLVGEGMITARDTVALHEARGVIMGLRIAGTLVDEILKSDTIRKDADERRRSNESDAGRRIAAATINTPAFSR